MKRGPFEPCLSAWCEGCLSYEGEVVFPIRSVLDEDGEPILRGDEDFRFKSGRAGDMYLVPFQCPLCHFRNLRGRDPSRDRAHDRLLMDFITRAVLDACWARETSTVHSNLASVKLALKSIDKFALRSALPAMGPFPLEDTLGMAQAIITLDRSLAKGKYERFVQWSTTRKVMSAMNNLSQAACEGLGESIGAYENKKIWFSKAVGHNFFISRFKEGLHRRVGEVVRPDEPITIEILKHILRALDEQWETEKSKRTPDSNRLQDIATAGAWYTIGFSVALRGEEMLLLEHAGTRRSLSNLTSPPANMPPHFDVIIPSPTKNNRVTGGKIVLPIVANCPSDLRSGVWVTRYLETRPPGDGPLFKRRFNRPRLIEFDDVFYKPLETLQLTRPDLVPDTLSIREDFGILRSLRRGSNGHAVNCSIPTEITHAINRWRSALRGSGQSSVIQDKYTRLDAIKPTMVKYSESL